MTRLSVLIALAISVHVLNGPRWPPPHQVLYYINTVSQDLSESAVIAGVRAGADAWAAAQSGANIHPTYAGPTTGAVLSRNFKNEIFFRDASGGSLYGETQWWYDGNNNLIDADILFYDAVRFFTGSSGCTDGVYLEDATAHEFGHALGFGHSDVGTATMYPTMSYCAQDVRKLDADDIAGLMILYPPTTQPPPPPPPDPTPTPTPVPGEMTLSVRPYKVKGIQHVDLTWSGTSATLIAIIRDGARITTTANDGAYTDNLNRKGGGSYAYTICEAATTLCSRVKVATF